MAWKEINLPKQTKKTVLRTDQWYARQSATHQERYENEPDHILKRLHKEAVLSQEEVLSRFREVHGDRYDYSKVKYFRWNRKVTVICKEHGEFQITPGNHIGGGSGCRKCTTASMHLSQDEVIRQFRKVHGDRYDYSKVEYVKNAKKVIIVCPDHGEFLQTPANHKKGVKCPECAKIKAPSKSNREVTNEFREVHGDRYDYSKVEYVKSSQKVTIICPDHGEFEQSPNSHLRGSGCPQCGKEKALQNSLKTRRGRRKT